MSPRQPSLAARLTVRLILLQVVTLLVFATCMPLVQILKGEGALNAPDPKIRDEIALALQPDGADLALMPTAAFATLASAYPALWFVATDAAGRQLRYGPVPEAALRLAESAPLVEVASFTEGALAGAVLARETTPAGAISVLFGNGPTVGFNAALSRAIVDNIGPLAVILVILASATAVLIPHLVGGSLTGLRRAVRRAATIDIDRRGTRLPTADVPTEIRTLVDAVNSALQRLDDGYDRQKRFLADAAHELRTPIAILQNRIELFATDALDPAMRGERLLLDVQRVANLAEQLLDLQRIDNGERSFAPVDLVAIARGVVGDLAPLMIDAGYAPQLSGERGSALVRGDASAIERALINLVQNAIAHGGNRGTIRVDVDADVVTVSDDGDGIPCDQRQSVLEPFHRLQPKDRGAGLGLSLVREIMARHDGTIVIDASPSGGARFSLHFVPAEVTGTGPRVRTAA